MASRSVQKMRARKARNHIQGDAFYDDDKDVYVGDDIDSFTKDVAIADVVEKQQAALKKTRPQAPSAIPMKKIAIWGGLGLVALYFITRK